MVNGLQATKSEAIAAGRHCTQCDDYDDLMRHDRR